VPFEIPAKLARFNKSKDEGMEEDEAETKLRTEETGDKRDVA
jgi:hypothetical protein